MDIKDKWKTVSTDGNIENFKVFSTAPIKSNHSFLPYKASATLSSAINGLWLSLTMSQ